MIRTSISILVFFALLFGCPDPDATFSDTYMNSGDIVVTNLGSGTVVLMDSDGNFKGVLYSVNKPYENVYGLGWNSDDDELLIVVDGSDRIVSMPAAGQSFKTAIANANLAGNLRGITQIGSGDYVVVESNNVERFDSTGIRITGGVPAWPILGIQNGGSNIGSLASGGFTLCSTTSDLVGTYDSDGAVVDTVAVYGTNTGAYGCVELPSGEIVSSWSGGNDTVVIYSSDLSTVNATYSDTTILPNPRGVAIAENGNILVVEYSYNYIIEIDTSGNYVRIIGRTAGLSSPTHIYVIP